MISKQLPIVKRKIGAPPTLQRANGGAPGGGSRLRTREQMDSLLRKEGTEAS
jgi:hypothetical protein